VIAYCILSVLLASPDERSNASSLDRILRQNVNFQKKEVELSEFFGDLAREHRLNVIIDSRIDRTFQLTLNAYKLPLEECLDRSAQLAGARAVMIGDVVYIGTKDSAERLSTCAAIVREQITAAADKVKKELLKPSDIQWDGNNDLYFLIKLYFPELKQGGEKLPKTTAKPQAVYKNVARVDALLSVLAHCDRTLNFDAMSGELKVAEIPLAPVMVRTVRPAKGSLRDWVARARDLSAQVEIEERDSEVILKGSYPAIRFVERQMEVSKSNAKRAARQRSRPPSSKPQEPRYSLELENVTLEVFVEKLRAKTGRQVTIDEKSLDSVGKGKEDRISCSANNLTIGELLDTTLKPSGLRHRIEGGRISIIADKH
jgi:hypothetical protein